MTETIHVMPVNDIFTHDQTVNCWCAPVVEEYDEGRVVIHNSADNREDFEDEINEEPL